MATFEIVRFVAAVMTMTAEFMVALNISARVTVLGFGMFVCVNRVDG